MINAIIINDEVSGLGTFPLDDGTCKGLCKTFWQEPQNIRKIVVVLIYLLSFNSLYGLTPQRQEPLKRNLDEEATPVQKEVDSLKLILRKTASETDKAEIYGQLCFTYIGALGDVGLARLFADSVKLIADKLQDESLIAASNYYYGVVGRYEGKYSQALDHLQLTIEYCNASGDSSRMPAALFQMAVVHQALGNYKESFSLSYKTASLYEKSSSYYGVAIALIHIGNLYARLKNNEKAIATYHQALTILDTLEAVLKVKMNKLRVLINLGNSYTTLKQYDKAREFYNRSLILSRLLGSKRTTATTLSNIGNVLAERGQYDSALVYHLEALAIREQTSQNDKLPVSLINVGETYMVLGDYSLASQFLLRALSMSKDFQSKPSLRDTYQKLSALYSAKEDYQKAYEYHQMFVVMKDSVLNEETVQQLGELQTKYETIEKDKQITLLAKEKQIQGKEMQRQTALNQAYAGGLIFVFVIGGLVFYILRQRMRLNAKTNEIKEADFKRRLTELEMKALRAQINPHFLFNCMNAINLMILKGQTENASLYLAKFSRLVRSILENAEASAVTLESEMALLESYMQLEELRLPGRFGYRISVDESIGTRNTYLPSMVLQPVVENAIWHGIVHKENDTRGNISIDVRQHDDQLLCTIEDDGIGRDKAQQLREKSLIKNKSMGMKITEERLRLRNLKYRGECIQITDLKDIYDHAIGTRVIIHIPIAEQND